MASKVYFADLRADVHENLQQKLTRLMKTAGMGDIDFQGQMSIGKCNKTKKYF